MSAVPQPEAVRQLNEFLPVDIPSREKSTASVVPRLRTLWEKRQILGRAMLAGLVAGTFVAFLIPSRFISETRLMPPDQQSGSAVGMVAMLTSGNSALAPIAGNLLGLKNSGDLFIGILQSRTVEDRIVDRFTLKSVYRTRLQQDARRCLEENTSISQDRKSGIISVDVSDRDPRRATAIAQAYVEELDHLVAQLSTSTAHRERVFLEERLGAVKRELDQAAHDFSQFESTNATLDIKEQGRAMFDAAATLTGQLIAAESELKGLEAIYTPNNVRVQAVHARIAELRRQLSRMRGIDGANSEAGGDSTYPSIRKLPLLGVTYMELYRQTKIKEALYESLTQQYELAKVQEAKETPTVKVLDAARVPEKKSFPPRLQIVFLCSFLSLIAAASLVLGQAHWKDMNNASAGKTLAREVLHSLRGNMPWAPTNGSRHQATANRIRARFRWRRHSDAKPD